jgi:hypothetical protein
MVISAEQLSDLEQTAIALLAQVRNLRDEGHRSLSASTPPPPRWVTIKAAIGYSSDRFKDERKLKAVIDRIYDDPSFQTGVVAGKHCERGISGGKNRRYYKVLIPIFFELL